MLGELPLLSGSMNLRSSLRLAFCSQRPWLLDETIEATITGGLQMEKTWYDRVIESCALKSDLETLSNNDQTTVGHEGSGLSGGQCQRIVSIA
jgi:ATP-binding cassette, subfamily C (CFTR/MRP), member 1